MIRRRIIFSVLGLTLLAACQPVRPDPGAAAKRITALEKSIASLKEERIETNRLLRDVAIRQDLLKKGMQRLARRARNDRVLLTGLRRDLEYDAGKMEEVATVISKMIDPMMRMQHEIANLRAKIVRLREKQSELEQQNPTTIFSIKDKRKKPAEEIPKMPVDEKKRKKVMDSVAFLPAQEYQEDQEPRHA